MVAGKSLRHEDIPGNWCRFPQVLAAVSVTSGRQSGLSVATGAARITLLASLILLVKLRTQEVRKTHNDISGEL